MRASALAGIGVRVPNTAYLVPLLGAGEGDDDEDEAAQLLLARHAVSLDAARLKQCGPPVPGAGQK